MSLMVRNEAVSKVDAVDGLVEGSVRWPDFDYDDVGDQNCDDGMDSNDSLQMMVEVDN